MHRVRGYSALAKRRPSIQFVAAMAGAGIEAGFRDEMRRLDGPDITLVRGEPRTVIAAGDAVLCASGTATLEVMLVNRPMVMTYKVAPSTYRLGQALKLVKLEWFSLPNILAGEGLVPELIQEDASGEKLAAAVAGWLDDEPRRAVLRARFDELHAELRCDAAARAAQAVAERLDAAR